MIIGICYYVFMVNVKNIIIIGILLGQVVFIMTIIVVLENYSNNVEFKIWHYNCKRQKVIKQGPWS